MVLLNFLTKRTFVLYLLYLVVILVSYFSVVHAWNVNGVLEAENVTYEAFLQAVSTYSLSVLVTPWLVVTLQALVVWLFGLMQAADLTYGTLWKATFWTYIIPVAIRGLLSNLILLWSGGPTPVSFGLGLLIPMPMWLDRVSDLFVWGQLYLFFTYFSPDGGVTRKQRWWLTAALGIGTLVSMLLV